VIRTLAYTPSQGLRKVADEESIADLLAQTDIVLWMDIEQPTVDDLNRIRSTFGFHELAIEDVERPHQRPKLDYYDTYRFLVLYAVAREDDTLTPSEVDLFVGQRYVVSVHAMPILDLDEAAQRWMQAAVRLDPGVVSLLYALLDAIVDGYFPALDLIADRVEEIEEAMIARTDVDSLALLFALKKQLIALRRVLAPERDILNGFLHRDWPRMPPSAVTYFQDVYDHVVRAIDSMDTYQDLLSNVLDVHVSLASNRLNVVVKRLTAIATILAVPTIVFSLYGMNFRHMPELEWEYGYPVALVSTLVISLAIAIFLRRRDWL